ncbi:WhiB family transcriptional regulator [Streptomyces sp. NPDC017979]|uniref:WhiB family transcriptional regulator n=1 Tax=Streptomyces sp. NPDC017979 TaxID=3365024 RepID=UPI0037BC4608
MSLPDTSPWQRSAACAGLPPSVVFARGAGQAAPALRACARCPVQRECEATVAPAESWFDGVCAGRLWRNGRPMSAARVARVVNVDADVAGAGAAGVAGAVGAASTARTALGSHL